MPMPCSSVHTDDYHGALIPRSAARMAVVSRIGKPRPVTRALLALLFLLSPAAFAQAGTAETKSAAARPEPAGQTAPTLVPISQSNSVPAKSPAQQAPAPALTDAAGALAEAQAALQAKQYDAAIALMNGMLE